MKQQHIQHTSSEGPGAKQPPSVNIFIIHTFRCGQGHTGDHIGNYMCRVVVARQLCHNTPVTFRPCQSLVLLSPSHTRMCVCVCVCYLRRWCDCRIATENSCDFAVRAQFCVCVLVGVKPPSLFICAHTHNNIIWHTVTSTA